jgi:hypothetical protein
MNDATIQPGQRTWGRLARDFVICFILLWLFLGSFGTPYLRIGRPYRFLASREAAYLGFTGTTTLSFTTYDRPPLLVLVPLKKSVAYDFWHALVAIKKFAFD